MLGDTLASAPNPTISSDTILDDICITDRKGRLLRKKYIDQGTLAERWSLQVFLTRGDDRKRNCFAVVVNVSCPRIAIRYRRVLSNTLREL